MRLSVAITTAPGSSRYRPRMPRRSGERASKRRAPTHLLPGADRVLASGPLVGGDWLVTTSHAVAVLAGNRLRWRREWHEIERGAWDDRASTITITWVDGTTPAELVCDTPVPRALLETFRERVDASVVHQERATLPGGTTARTVIRRTGDGTLLSQTTAESSQPLSAAAERALEALERRARSEVGLTG